MLNRSTAASRPDPADPTVTDLLRLRAAVGLDLGDPSSLAPRSQRAVRVAGAVGAPLLDALDVAASAEDDARDARRAITVASAQTRAVAGGLLLAPVFLVPGLGRLVGADLLAFYRTPLGFVVGAVGMALLLTGAAMVALLVRRVGRPASSSPTRSRRSGALVVALVVWWLVHPLGAVLVAAVVAVRERRQVRVAPVPAGFDEAADLVATALSGGLAPAAALRIAAEELTAHAPSLRRLALDLELGLQHTAAAETADTGPARLRAVLTTAADVGAPAAPALRRLAADLRADELARILAAAERLPAQLTFPTTLCLLPATLLLVGAPMVSAGLAAAAV